MPSARVLARTATSLRPPTSVARDQGQDPRILLQFVRKLSGASKAKRAKKALFNLAVDEVAAAAERLVHGWVTSVPPKDRNTEIRKMIDQSQLRFEETQAHALNRNIHRDQY